jgi:hypothetical protein
MLTLRVAFKEVREVDEINEYLPVDEMENAVPVETSQGNFGKSEPIEDTGADADETATPSYPAKPAEDAGQLDEMKGG